MSEAGYGELFDFYCIAILADLYENRGRRRQINHQAFAKQGPTDAPVELRQEAALNAVFWLKTYGYADGQHTISGPSYLIITPQGMEAYGKPVPGEAKVSTGAKAAGLVKQAAEKGFDATVSEGVSQIMESISFSGFAAKVVAMLNP